MLKIKPIDIQNLPISKIIIVGLIIIILFLIKGCPVKELTINSEEGFKALMAEQKLKYKRDSTKWGQDRVVQQEYIANVSKELEKKILENSTLKSINKQIKVESSTKIENVLAVWGVQTSTLTKVDSTQARQKDSAITFEKAVPVGTTFYIDTKWYDVHGKVTSTGALLQYVDFRDSLTVNLGFERKPGLKGLFSEKIPVVEVIHGNPDASTIGLNNLTINPPKKKFFQKPIPIFISGLIVGAFSIIYIAK